MSIEAEMKKLNDLAESQRQQERGKGLSLDGPSLAVKFGDVDACIAKNPDNAFYKKARTKLLHEIKCSFKAGNLDRAQIETIFQNSKGHWEFLNG